jgi:hypothetical protein
MRLPLSSGLIWIDRQVVHSMVRVFGHMLTMVGIDGYSGNGE